MLYLAHLNCERMKLPLDFIVIVILQKNHCGTQAKFAYSYCSSRIIFGYIIIELEHMKDQKDSSIKSVFVYPFSNNSSFINFNFRLKSIFTDAHSHEY